MLSNKEKLVLSQETLRLLTTNQPRSFGGNQDTTIPMVCLPTGLIFQ